LLSRFIFWFNLAARLRARVVARTNEAMRVRADAAHEREEERSHQLAMVEAIKDTFVVLLDAQSRQNRDNAEALMEIAKASAAQAEGFSTWINSFAPTDSPTSSHVREEDEYAAEQARVASALGIDASMLEHIPEEFLLAHQLHTNTFRDSIAGDMTP
jgi:hypothetical protein